MEIILIIKNILTKIKVHPIFFFLAFASVITGLFKEFLIFTSIIFIHELGHTIMAIIFKWNIKVINFYPFGGYIEFDEILNKPIKEEFLIVISGLLIQSIYFMFICYLYYNNYILENTFIMFRHYHYSIFLFNIIPIYPLDGIKIVNLVLSKYFSYKTSHKVSIIISIIFIIIFIFFSINNYLNMNILLILGLLFNQIIQEKRNHNMLCSKFIFERYLYSLKFSKRKVISSCNVNKMFRDYTHIFKKNGEYITEKKILKGKFEKNK